MRKRVRRYFRRSLCGMLSAAMIAASLITPNMTALAAPQDETGLTETEETEKDKLVDETTGENETEVGKDQDSDLGDSDADSDDDVTADDEDNAADDDQGDLSDKDGESEDPSEGTDETDEESGDDDVEEPDEEDGDLTGDEVEDSDLDEKEDEGIMLSMLPMATGGYGELENGDFEEYVVDDGGSWVPASWEVSGDGNGYKNNDTDTNTTYLVSWWASDAGTISLSQTVDNIEPGEYVLSLETYGDYKADADDPISVEIKRVKKTGSEYADVDSKPLLQKSLGQGPGWTWSEFKTEAFEISVPDGETSVNIEIALAGKRGSGETIKVDNIKLQSKDEAESEGSNFTFYYYVGETDDEIGLYYWGNNITSDVEKAEWGVWVDGDTYPMSPVTGYTGWYSVPLSIANGGADSGFQIYKKADAVVNTETKNALCKFDVDNNGEIYDQLVSGDESAYAVKNYKCYAGEDSVKAILRNVTLYVYSTDDVPVIMVEKSEYGKLSVIDESTGALSELNADSYYDAYQNYYYSMEKDEKANWYRLTFAVPGNISFDSKKVINLYTKSSSGTYTWVKNLLNGSSGVDSWSVDITPVFSGSVYYKDGVLSDSRSVTLGDLRALVTEAEATDKKGQGAYSDSSWNVFQTALDAAKDVVSTLADEDDDYTDESSSSNDTKVETAYVELEAAINGLVMEVTLYYYVGQAEAAGFTYWANDGLDPIATTAGTTTSWHAYNGDDTTYEMTAVVGYPGWYSIPITFSHDGGEDAGFSIHSYNGERSSEIFVCSKKWNSTDVYEQLVSGDEKAYAVKKSRCYGGDDLINALMRNVKIYVYDNVGTPAIGASGEVSLVNESTGKKDVLNASAVQDGIYYYDMIADENNTNWYYLSFSAPAADQSTQSICGLYSLTDAQGETYTLVKTFVEGEAQSEDTVDFRPVFSGDVYYKNGIFYPTRPATLDDLIELVEEAEALKEYEEDEDKEDRYEHDNAEWTTFEEKLDDAKAVVEQGSDESQDEPTDEAIIAAYNGLRAAMKALIPIPAKAESISVERVAVDDDFIMGVDVSSYVSVKESGVVFKDENGNALSDAGFFKMLHDGGANWVRIRIWNDPYNSSNGGGYGGGNSDLDKAKILGKLATDAGMKVLIDFHYSDFWADPSKQDAPKAWASYTVSQKETAVYKYTSDSLDELRAAGVNVCMVQVGNETNNGICGEYEWENMAKIFNAGSEAVRDFDPECLVAIHFAEPQDSSFLSLPANLETYGVDYDVFASSYYPFWHGDTDNLTDKLKEVARQYDKKVMVAETSWVTSWDDGDGHGNSAPKTTQELNYAVSLQGQADEIRDVVKAVEAVNDDYPDKAIGMFYWEPAWISPYYVYNADGSIDQSLYKKNQELWEKYGSGWASSYSVEYDPTDAGLWYGGSAVDNQAWFDFDGKALETTKVYSYIRTAATADGRNNAISTVQADIIARLNVGDSIQWNQWDDKIEMTFNDGKKYTGVDSGEEEDVNAGSPITALTVKWDEQQQELVNTDRAGVYTVAGTVTCTYKLKADEEATATEKFNITLTIQVLSAGNILQNPGFEENSLAPWNVSDKDATLKSGADTTPYTGTQALHFYDEDGDGLNFTANQTIANVKAGTYTFGGYIQGGGVSDTDIQYAYVQVYRNGKSVGNYRTSCYLGGYNNWIQPEISGIKVSEGDTLVVGMEVHSSKAKAWGTIDDCYLYGDYGIEIDPNIEHGKLTVSNLEASSKEIVRITATPNSGYYLSKLTVAGDGVTGSGIELAGDGATLDSSAETGTAVLLYNGEAVPKSDATMFASFKMPDTSISISAEFTSVFGGEKIDLNDVTVAGFTEDAQGRLVYNTEQEYTGKNIQLGLDISYCGYQLTTADYTASYSNNKNVTSDDSMAEIKLKAKGQKFTGQITLYFKIVDTKVDISKAKISYAQEYDDAQKNTYYYTGEEIEPGVAELTDKTGIVLTDKSGGALTLTTDDYTVQYQNNLKVGKATMIVIAKDGSTKIKGSITQTFTIAKRPITDAAITISKPSGGTYTGGKITPSVTVVCGNKILQNGKDYKLTYSNNVNVSTNVTDEKKLPCVKVTGIGSYTGSTDKTTADGDRLTFSIWEKSLGDLSVTAVISDLIYNNGKDMALKLTVKNGTKSLAANKQYRIAKIVDSKNTVIYEYDKNTGKAADESQKQAAKVSEKGTYKVTLEGLGSYSNTKVVQFSVVGEEYMLSKATVGKIPNQIYTGNKIELSNEDLVVKNKNGDLLEYDKDYTVTYTNNIKAGTAKLTISAKRGSLYAGTKTATFKIVKRAIVDSAESLKASQDINDVGVISFEFPETDAAYCEDGVYCYPYTGYNWTPEFKVYSTNGSVKKTLMKGTDYTITYKNNQKANDCLGEGKYASITITGKGSYSGKATFNDVFKVKDVTLDDFAVTVNPVTYSGKAIKPAITFVYKETGEKLDVKAGTAYTVKYLRNTNVASLVDKAIDKDNNIVNVGPCVQVKEKGLRTYTTNDDGKVVTCSTKDKQQEDIYFTITTAQITAASVTDIKVQTYNGKPSMPKVTVKVNGRSLKAGTDYLVTYQNNTGRNKEAVATIVGIGNYSGKVDKKFTIK